MEKIVSKIAALGVPGLILTVLIHAAGGGLSGFLIAMSVLGPGGFWGGMVTLGVIGLISQGLTQYGLEAMCSDISDELIRRGETRESILAKIERCPISSDLKRKLREQVNH